MIFEKVRDLDKGCVLRSSGAHPRMIVLPAGSSAGTPEAILGAEENLRQALLEAFREVRPSSMCVNGVYLEFGGSCDLLVMNRFSRTTKAALQVVAHPQLVDLELAREFCSGVTGSNRLVLVSESGCINLALPARGEAVGSLLHLGSRSAPSHDAMGSVADYLREQFGEGMPIGKPIVLPRGGSPHS